MFSYVSIISTEYATGTDGNSFLLAKRITIKLVFDESINSLYLSEYLQFHHKCIWIRVNKRYLRPFLRDPTAEVEVQEVEIYS